MQSLDFHAVISSRLAMTRRIKFRLPEKYKNAWAINCPRYDLLLLRLLEDLPYDYCLFKISIT
ncbi:MAG: hypothetical protein J6U05_08235 [Neisseriaceae bacterium]|nr:hypothetical protein [Neisseriaceae bacterium]